MPKYVAKIKSPQLKKIPDWSTQIRKSFEYLGFTNVKVGPDSSVYFEYWMKSVKALAWHIHRIILKKLALECKVTVENATEHPPKT